MDVQTTDLELGVLTWTREEQLHLAPVAVIAPAPVGSRLFVPTGYATSTPAHQPGPCCKNPEAAGPPWALVSASVPGSHTHVSHGS